MRVVSWNVQGLGGSQCARYRGRLRQELQRCLVGGSIDVFLIQEHHLCERRIKRYGSVLRGKSDVFWSAGFGPMGGQGGVCMSVAEAWQSAVRDRVIVVPGRAQYITMQYHDAVIGILNVYAPNQASARADFWALLAAALPRVDSWCIGGDFNMLESPEDRIGGSHVTVHESELAAWEQLCMSLRIFDTWLLEDFSRTQGSLGFSQLDRRRGGTNLARLDRFYVSDGLCTRGGSVGILAGTTFLDHAPGGLGI